jgi:uncharacterized protein
MPVVLSYIQARALLDARHEGRASITLSPDLGLTLVNVWLSSESVQFADGQQVSWLAVDEIQSAPTVCFALEAGSLRKIHGFSQETNRFCSLMPTAGAPTLLLAGFPMHRIKGTDPHEDTLNKVKAVAPVVGHVLDTATGLGYTAIEASRTASQVVTVELDPAVLDIARQNPWSQHLFGNPKIAQLVGDSTEVVTEFPDGSFTRIIHDPPTFSLAGELYSEAFYRQLFRVLRRGGRMFHYIGDLDSNLGRRISKGASRRLREAGFEKVRPNRQAFGLVAIK